MINLFMLCCACGFSACAGLSALQEDNHQEFKQQEKIEFKQDNKKYVSYNDNDYIITLNINELNSYIFHNLSVYIVNEYNYNNFSNTTIECNTSYLDGGGDVFSFDDYEAQGEIVYLSQEVTDLYIHFYVDGDDNFVLSYESDSFDFDSQLVWNLNSSIYSGIKSAIELDIQANTTGQEDYQNALGQFVQILVSGIQSLATGVASGIVGMASALFLETDNGSVTGLSVFGGIVAIFAGLALAIGITTKVYTWVTSLGN